MRPIVIRKEKTTSFHPNERAMVGGFWKPAKPFISPFLMNKTFAKPELATNIEQMLSGAAKMAETCASMAKDASAPVSEAVKEANNAVTNISRGGEARNRAAASPN